MNGFALKPLLKRSGKKRSFFSGQAKKVKKYIFSEIALKCLCAFLLSRTGLIGGASPLGFGFFAANFSGSGAYSCAAAFVLGLIFSGKSLLTIGKYVISLTLFSLIYERFLKEKYKTSRVSALMASLCLLFTGTFLLFTDITFGGYPLIYDSMILVIECATLWLSVRAFSIVLDMFSGIFLRRTLTSEETVSLAFFTGGVLCGLGEITFFNAFSFSGVLCVLSVLLFALRFGALHGCCAGIIMGVINCLTRGRIDVSAVSFAVSGLCAGYFSKYGKWSLCVSFIIANSAVTILTNGSTEILINLFDTTIASVILYCMPKKVFGSLEGFATANPTCVKFAANKLRSAQSTLKNCEKGFQHVFDLRNNEDYNTLLLYRRTARNICGSCGLRKYCWGRDAKATKEAMDMLCTALVSGGEASEKSAPPHCLRKEQFVAEFERMFGIYKNDCIWTQKVSELRVSSYSVFSALAKILGLCEEDLVNGAPHDMVASDNLRSKLKKDGILASEVYVTGKDDDMNIQIKLERCGGFGRCENAVCNILESTFGKSFVRTGVRNCGECVCNYVVKPAFSVTTAVASAIKTKKSVSGDHAVYALLDRHTYAMILCDGMGSGEVAREESKTCANLLLNLLGQKIEPEMAINIINSMLLWAFSGSITAIDLCLVNLDDGSSKIYKCGGAGSFAKTKNTVSVIASPTLPAGSLSNSDTKMFQVDSEKGSFLVMVSDGVIGAEGKTRQWISKMIESYDGNEPEELSRMILSRAKEISQPHVQDDLTVMTAYIG